MKECEKKLRTKERKGTDMIKEKKERRRKNRVRREKTQVVGREVSAREGHEE